jgi:hypothetical protein
MRRLTFNRTFITVVLLAAGVIVVQTTLCNFALADDAKTGSFETTFTERSPQSELKSLVARLKVLGPGEKIEQLQDYDLSKEGFWVYVPEKYNPAQPMGLLVLALYKGADVLPEAVLPQLAEVNVALVVPKQYLDTWWKRAGLTLDAAYNMQQLYKIDPKRVYIFGGGDWADADGKQTEVAPRVAVFYPDVFTGTFLAHGVQRYRLVKGTGNSLYKQQIPKPEAAQLKLAQTHPFAVGLIEGEGGQASAASYKADGFKYGKVIPVSTEQYHYPNLTTDWLPDVLKYLDGVVAEMDTPADSTSTKDGQTNK